MLEVIKNRHSVRSYLDKRICGDVKEKLDNIIKECNKEGNLNIKLFLDEPKAFNSIIAKYGKFEGVKNYFVIIGKKSDDLEARCGYYGEKIVLEASKLGLNTCFVGMTYSKNKVPYKFKNNEKMVIAVAIGYGKTQGVLHKSKDFNQVSLTSKGNAPDWYKKGVEYALLAPTALNQQKFKFELFNDNEVKLTCGVGFFTKVDLGIVRYHFELGANTKNFNWIEI